MTISSMDRWRWPNLKHKHVNSAPKQASKLLVHKTQPTMEHTSKENMTIVHDKC